MSRSRNLLAHFIENYSASSQLACQPTALEEESKPVLPVNASFTAKKGHLVVRILSQIVAATLIGADEEVRIRLRTYEIVNK